MIDLLIITPTLNAEKYLSNCLISSFKLRQLGARHIIIDSGSIDSTIDIAKSFGIEVLYCPPGNMYRAINFGINKFKEIKWVTYINADDYLYEETIIELFNNNILEEYDVLYSNIDFINRFGNYLHHFRTVKVNFLKYYFLQGIMPIPQQGTIFKNKVFQALNGFSINKKYSSDFDFFMRAYINNYKFHKIRNTQLAAFRLHQDQISQNFHLIMRQEVSDSIKSIKHKSNIVVFFIFSVYLKLINIDSYISRIIRFYFLNNKLRFNTTMKIDD